MSSLRITVQVIVILLFVLFLTWPEALAPVNFLFKINMLAIPVAAVSALTLFTGLVFTLITLILTLRFGRFFCGWICPLGSFIDAVDKVSARKPKWIKAAGIKYYLLLIIILAATGGLSVAWVLDPMSWAARTWGIFSRKSDSLNTAWFFMVFLILFSILGGRRAFCRMLCPLGAALAVIARFSRFSFKRSDTCSDCGTCAFDCRMAAIDPDNGEISKSECIQCQTCVDSCKMNALEFDYSRFGKAPEFSLSRRSVLTTLGIGVVSASSMRTLVTLTPEKRKLRPPGAKPEDVFNNLCIRCNSCVQACPTGGLEAAAIDISPVQMLTPVLSGRKGGCDYNCNACGKVCPSGAIEHLSLHEKRRTVIGHARLERKRCIPYAKQESCLACYSACPLDAVNLKEAPIKLRWGDRLLLPVVNDVRCTGCGLCEAVCPVEGSAIKVHP